MVGHVEVDISDGPALSLLISCVKRLLVPLHEAEGFRARALIRGRHERSWLLSGLLSLLKDALHHESARVTAIPATLHLEGHRDGRLRIFGRLR